VRAFKEQKVGREEKMINRREILEGAAGVMGGVAFVVAALSAPNRRTRRHDAARWW
jgi:hypothetical protein